LEVFHESIIFLPLTVALPQVPPRPLPQVDCGAEARSCQMEVPEELQMEARRPSHERGRKNHSHGGGLPPQPIIPLAVLRPNPGDHRQRPSGRAFLFPSGRLRPLGDPGPRSVGKLLLLTYLPASGRLAGHESGHDDIKHIFGFPSV
jgi:hypothetical protein